MDLVKKWMPVRATIIKFYKSLIIYFEMEVKLEDAKSKFASLERAYDNLTNLDDDILELLLKRSDKYCAEYEILQEYMEKFYDGRIRLNYFSRNLALPQSYIGLGCYGVLYMYICQGLNCLTFRS